MVARSHGSDWSDCYGNSLLAETQAGGRWNYKLSLVVAGGSWRHVASSTCWSRLTDVQPTGEVYRWGVTVQTPGQPVQPAWLYLLLITHHWPGSVRSLQTPDCRLKVTDVNLIVIISLSLSHITRPHCPLTSPSINAQHEAVRHYSDHPCMLQCENLSTGAIHHSLTRCV